MKKKIIKCKTRMFYKNPETGKCTDLVEIEWEIKQKKNADDGFLKTQAALQVLDIERKFIDEYIKFEHKEKK